MHEIAAGHRHRHLALGALEPGSGNRRRAGRRAAGLGQAGAALPGADDDVLARDDLRERDIGALRERSDGFPVAARNCQDRRRCTSSTQKIACGLPMLTTDGRMQHRLVDRADLQLDRAGVAEFFRQRNLVPAQTRRAHVDGELTRPRALPALHQPGPGLEQQALVAAAPWPPARRRSACRCRRRRPPSRHCCRCARTASVPGMRGG